MFVAYHSLTNIRNGEEELVIEQMLELREAESDLLMFEVLHKDKQAEVNSYLMSLCFHPHFIICYVSLMTTYT